MDNPAEENSAKAYQVTQMSKKNRLGFILASVIVSRPKPHGVGEKTNHVKIRISN